jgi:hypothetical protein
MNTNQKKLKLISHGLKALTLNKLTEGQVNVLFNKLTESKKETDEAVTQNVQKTTYSSGEAKGKSFAGTTTLNPDGSVTVTKEGEMKEDIEIDKDNETKGGTSQDPVQVQGPDGMDDDSDKELQEKFESKKQQKYFFAKCGEGKTKEQKKWCKMADEFAKKTNFAKLPKKKVETKENFDFKDYGNKVVSTVTKLNSDNLNKVNPVAKGMGNPSTEFFGESEIERHIMRLVEKHITPKMSKKDILSLLGEDTKVAPDRTKEKEKVKPGKDNPYKPKPGVKPSPKAKKEIGEDTKTAPAKPTTKPTTKPGKDSPYKPKPGVNPAPKAKKNLPSWLSFSSLGLKLKG